MDEKKKLTAFEQAFFDYREGTREMQVAEQDFNLGSEYTRRGKVRREAGLQQRTEALVELKRHMTPEAFAELTGADKAVTP